MLWIALALAACLAAGCSRQESRWRDAEHAGTVAAYQSYLADYPGGPHAAEARARVRALREQEDWARASRLRTPEAWQRYLADWPDGRHAAEARALLSGFVPGGTAIAAGWWVQLGAFASEAGAGAARTQLGARHAAELSGLELAVLAPAAPGTGIWRLRAGPLAEDAARALCARLRERGADCVPVAG